MPLLDPGSFCIELDPDTGLKLGAVSFKFLSLTFPGGATLSASGQNAVDDILNQLNAALAPLQPLFNIIDVLLAAKKAFDALKDVDVPAMLKLIPKWVKALDKLKNLLPPVSIPVMLRGVLDLLIAFLQQLKAELTAMLSVKAKIDLGRVKAARLASPDLNVALDCAQSQIDVYLLNINSSATPMNRLIALLNLLGGSAGCPEIPSLSFSGDVGTVLASLDPVISALQDVRSKIP